MRWAPTSGAHHPPLGACWAARHRREVPGLHHGIDSADRVALPNAAPRLVVTTPQDTHPYLTSVFAIPPPRTTSSGPPEPSLEPGGHRESTR
ncbi:hypothetical protein SAMN04487820_113110 [Actinopolyspora mzabensis]|uniref:Uncharacterized protein n=1 Tax=Actinopolyspora mzabensis TaxID=995066 RepID=A0A1G9F0H2_ACTMZ|nr:hypothetical protein SAMN04487820_113110 [Actinopolyspora mzabensis]